MDFAFSKRLPASFDKNRITRLRHELPELPFDLTVSNPTRCGFEYPPRLLAPLAAPDGLTYQPETRGPQPCREAIAASYDGFGCAIDKEQIVATASTSEAYSFLFKLLTDPGDTIMVSNPCYPLFDSLARLDNLNLATYSMDLDAGCRLDFADLENAPSSTRAVVVVQPNNPTGSLTHPDDADRLEDLCHRRGWSLIADEVFLPFVFSGGEEQRAQSFAGRSGCPVFSLGGFSKSLGLPQLKLAWIVVSGPQELRPAVMERLDFITDAYLSVNTPVALHAAELIAAGNEVARQITSRCQSNLTSLDAQCLQVPAVTRMPSAGGWSAVLRIPTVVSEEDLVVSLMADHGVAVHPGYFYDFPAEGFLVLSLLPHDEVFSAGIQRTLAAIADSIR